ATGQGSLMHVSAMTACTTKSHDDTGLCTEAANAHEKSAFSGVLSGVGVFCLSTFAQTGRVVPESGQQRLVIYHSDPVYQCGDVVLGPAKNLRGSRDFRNPGGCCFCPWSNSLHCGTVEHGPRS